MVSAPTILAGYAVRKPSQSRGAAFDSLKAERRCQVAQFTTHCPLGISHPFGPLVPFRHYPLNHRVAPTLFIIALTGPQLRFQRTICPLIETKNPTQGRHSFRSGSEPLLTRRNPVLLECLPCEHRQSSRKRERSQAGFFATANPFSVRNFFAASILRAICPRRRLSYRGSSRGIPAFFR